MNKITKSVFICLFLAIAMSFGAIVMAAAPEADQPAAAVNAGEEEGPTGFGLFWHNFKDSVSLGFTFDQDKKQAKRLQWAEERLKWADWIKANSTNPDAAAKAEGLIKKANDMIKRVEDRAAKKALKEDDKNKVDQLKTRIKKHEGKDGEQKQGSRPGMKPEKKMSAKAEEMKEKIAGMKAEKERFLTETKSLREKARAGDVNARKELLARVKQLREKEMALRMPR